MVPDPRIRLHPALLLALCLLAPRAGAQEPGTSEVRDRKTLTAGWWGAARPAADLGITLEAVYTGEVISNLSGGFRKRTEYLDNLDVMLTVKTDPLLGLEGGTLFLYGLGNTGGDPSRQNVGDHQVISNIETDNTFKVYEAWYEQRFLDDRLSLKSGLYDLNSEFDLNETGALFTQSSHGIGPDFSQSGLNGPSIFSTTALAIRARAEVTDGLAFRFAVLDAVAGDPGEFRRTQITWKTGEGLLLASEVTWIWTLSAVQGRAGLGAWAYTEKFEDVLDTDLWGRPVERRGNRGAYVILEAGLLRESDLPGEDQGLDAFLRCGWADRRFNQVGNYVGGGVVYTGLIPGRDRDRLGLAVAWALNGRDFRRSRRRAGDPARGSEMALELTYLTRITPWLSLQPVAHYVIHPGTDPGIRNAFALGVRFEVTL